jgi:excinuclease ABC subunit C
MEFDRSKYPETPGVYLMKDSAGAVIYIGKAASLRARLSQYFGSGVSGKTAALVSQVADIDFVITKDPNEALVLESNMIKSHMPKFNMLLKDAKHYSYLAITDEKFPRLMVARKNSAGGFRVKASRIFGPYVEGSKRAISSIYLRKLFKIRICRKLPKRECLQFHLGNCDAPCIGRISEEEYNRNVDALADVLKGGADGRGIIGALKVRMQNASKAQDYEAAKTIRDQMDALGIFFERQRVERRGGTDEDFMFLQRIGSVLHVRILKSRNGIIRWTEKHDIDVKAQEEPELAFCAQYYADMAIAPGRVYTNLDEVLSGRLNAALGAEMFRVPHADKIGVLRIASDSLKQAEIEPSVLRLQEALGLLRPPLVIETFDISTLFGENSVGSMVRFQNGKPDKNNYRKFKIRGIEGQDDFAMMNEVVSRRYARLRDEGAAMPDLVLIDGGLGQLHAAQDAIVKLGLELEIASIAKREEEIYQPTRLAPLRLQRSDLGLRLVQHCRDEAHRFAISYHRKRREKAAAD